MDLMKFVENEMLNDYQFEQFKPGDNVVVSYKIVEGAKERIQDYRGDVIQVSGEGKNKTFTARKISNGVGDERIFPMSSPAIVGLKVTKRGKVRRAKLYYLRELIGKKARIREKKTLRPVKK